VLVALLVSIAAWLRLERLTAKFKNKALKAFESNSATERERGADVEL
jgi:hypothetical protein